MSSSEVESDILILQDEDLNDEFNITPEPEPEETVEKKKGQHYFNQRLQDSPNTAKSTIHRRY